MVNQVIKNKEQGVALIMALLILALIMVSVLSLSKIIISEVKMSVNTGNSIGAFYAAESGIEKGLYYIKYSREQSDFVYFTDLKDEEQDLNSYANFKITNSTISSLDFVAYNIGTSTPAHLDIIDPSGEVSDINWGLVPGAVYKYQVFWKINNCFPDHSSDRLEISANYFESLFTKIGVDKKVIICNCGSATADQCDATVAQFNISDERYYRFSFRPLDSKVDELHFDVYENNVPIAVQSEANIEVEGKFKNSKFKLKANLPSLVPVSDVFTYIIFSEEELVKDTP